MFPLPASCVAFFQEQTVLLPGDAFRLTPTQQRFMRLLADGLPHTEAEMRACIDDELSVPSNLNNHLYLLRKKLRPRGYDVIVDRLFDGQRKVAATYRYVRLLASSYDGYK